MRCANSMKTPPGIGAGIGAKWAKCANSGPKGPVKMAQVNSRIAELARELAHFQRAGVRL